MTERVYIPCPMCPKNWVPEDGKSPVCHECEPELLVITSINDVVDAINKLGDCDGNRFKEGHVLVLRRAQEKLEGLLNVLERYPKRD